MAQEMTTRVWLQQAPVDALALRVASARLKARVSNRSAMWTDRRRCAGARPLKRDEAGPEARLAVR